MDKQTICRVDDAELVRCIEAASGRVVFAAPGLSKAVATALGAAWRKSGRDQVSVILDVDPSVCRLGYGSLEGLHEIQGVATGVGGLVCHQPGLRVGILVTDHVTLVYTPTPLLIEPEPGMSAHATNGIALASPPGNLSRELGIGPEAEGERTIGLEQVPAKRVQSLAADLKANPPLPFDIARPVLVFNSQVEFVEFSLEKIQLQRQEIPIPPEVMGLGSSRTQEPCCHPRPLATPAADQSAAHRQPWWRGLPQVPTRPTRRPKPPLRTRPKHRQQSRSYPLADTRIRFLLPDHKRKAGRQFN